VAGGYVACSRCGLLIEPGTPWDLGHPDSGSSGGPEHRRCNRRAGGVASMRARSRRVSLLL
jgi:hypothetical protein